VSQVLAVLAVLALAGLVLAVEVRAAGVLIGRALLLLKFEPGDQEACPRLVRYHPSEGRPASAGVAMCHCLEGDRHPKSHRQCCIPRYFLYKSLGRLPVNGSK
jgi:hypothetical protein